MRAPLLPALLAVLALAGTACGASPQVPAAAAPPPPVGHTVSVGEVVTDADGVQVRVERLRFEPVAGTTTLELGITNGSDHPVDLLGRATTLVGDDGTVHDLVATAPGPGNDVPPGGDGRVELTVAGELAGPGVTLRLNTGGGASAGRPGTRTPPFELGPFDPTASDAVPARPDVWASTTLTHPNGTQLRVDRIGFADSRIAVEVTATGGQGRPVQLGGPGRSYVEDDLGNRYRLIPAPEDPALAVTIGNVLSGVLVFAGRLHPDATSVRVVVNEGDGASADDPATATPTFVAGPFEVGTGSPPPGAPPLQFGLRSAVGDRSVATSLAEEVAIIAGELGGTRTDEGIVLTVPEDVLFDFDSAELGPGADSGLADLATLLNYYPDAAALIVGHTDSRGEDAYNLDLSLRRATTVLEALVTGHGLDRGRLTAEGRGEREPVAADVTPDGTDDPAAQQRNRRVELVILTDEPLP